MKIKQFEIWIADLNPGKRTETGKVRPVIVIQTDLLNKEHPSTIICPITTNVKPDSEILRVHLKKSKFGLKEDCDISLEVVNKLYQYKHPMRFILFEGADHGITEFLEERLVEMKRHFDYYLRDGNKLPDMEPHGR